MIHAKSLIYDYETFDSEGNADGVVRALDDISVDINRGSFVAILGRNGSGKSTLAKQMNALLLPTSGTVWVDGKDTRDDSELWNIRQSAGMVFQNPDNQIVGTVVEEDVGFGPENMGIPTEEIWVRVNKCLKRMGLEYVDIFYHHRMDPATPLEETMGALEHAVRSGKALYVGLSNYDGQTLEKASAILSEMRVPFVINQNRYNILDRTVEQNGLKETASKLKKGIICFTPLAQGVLTDRYLRGIPADSRVRTDSRFLKESSLTEEKIGQVRRLNEIAQSRGQTLAEMALAWILKDDAVTSVLIGASKPSQILDNIKAIENTAFSAEELRMIDEAVMG